MKIGNIEIDVERKQIKNMHLSVYPPNGRVHISVPSYLNDNDIQSFIVSKWDWVLRQRKDVLGQARQTDRAFVSGEDHYLFGTRYRLKVNYITTGAYMVEVKGNVMTMSIAESSSVARRQVLMQEFYRDELKTYLAALMEKWQEQLNEPDVTWQVKMMKTQWGSCRSKKRSLLFNLQLARVPKECIEYVVVHELTHLKIDNHSRLFEELLSRRLSNWRARRKRLNAFIALQMKDIQG